MAGAGLDKDSRNVAIRLARLEAGLLGRYAPIYCAVPPRLQTPIEDILDSAAELKGCVLLGFSRDGSHLVSYTLAPAAATNGEEGHCLQLWTFDRHATCRKLWNIPLFRACTSLGQQDDECGFASAASSLNLIVAETPGGELLVVHGRAVDVEMQPSDRHLNHLTIIPGPKYALSAQQLQVAHLSYHTAAPNPLFNPFISLLTVPTTSRLTTSESHPTLGLACNLGDGLRMVTLTVSVPASTQQRQQQEQQQLQHDPGANQQLGSPPPRATAAPSNPPDPDGVPAAAFGAFENPRGASLALTSAEQEPSGSLLLPHAEHKEFSSTGSGVAAGVADSWGAQDGHVPGLAGSQPVGDPGGDPTAAPGLEQLQSEMDLGYACVPCSSWSPPTMPAAAVEGDGGSNPTSVAAVGVLPAGPALDWEEFIFQEMRGLGLPLQCLEDYGCALVAQGDWRGRQGVLGLALLALRSPPGVGGAGGLRCLLAHLAADSGLAEVVEALEPPFPWEADLSRAMQQAGGAGLCLPLDRQAVYAADWLRRRSSAPGSRRHLPHVLTNRNVLEAGRSLKYIAHPWLPQCVLGYRAAPGGRRGSGRRA